ncbi:unnamed protein product [Amoebophrya sp. A120]|nr:unnamed protein product [Amoebophrya sp. A120]|eukprot:GSA120T00004047001.1
MGCCASADFRAADHGANKAEDAVVGGAHKENENNADVNVLGAPLLLTDVDVQVNNKAGGGAKANGTTSNFEDPEALFFQSLDEHTNQVLLDSPKNEHHNEDVEQEQTEMKNEESSNSVLLGSPVEGSTAKGSAEADDSANTIMRDDSAPVRTDSMTIVPNKTKNSPSGAGEATASTFATPSNLLDRKKVDVDAALQVYRKELASSPDRTSSVHDAEDFAENVKPKTLGLTDTRPKGGVRKALATEKPSNWVPFVSSIHLRPMNSRKKTTEEPVAEGDED